MEITYEYLPYLSQFVYIKKEIIEKYQEIESTVPRLMVWSKWSWCNTPSANPLDWTEFRFMAHGVVAAS